MPDKMIGRQGHSINVVGICDNSIWVMFTKGIIIGRCPHITLSEIDVVSDIIRLLLNSQPEQVLCRGQVPIFTVHMAQVVMDFVI